MFIAKQDRASHQQSQFSCGHHTGAQGKDAPAETWFGVTDIAA
jgi:hypothetical protein